MGVRKPKPDEKEDFKKEKPKEKKPEKKRKTIEGVRGIVRVSEIDLDGNKKLRNALLGVKGIGKSLSKGIVIASGLDAEALLGSLTEEQIKKLEEVIRDPGKYGIPYHMLNRRFDPSTGQHMHLVSSKLSFAIRSDIDFMKKIKCYKGVRHELGLPVRGQRTRTSFRKGGIVGVAKIRLKQGAAPAGKEALPGEEKAPTAAKAPTEAKVGEAKSAAPAKSEKKEEKKLK